MRLDTSYCHAHKGRESTACTHNVLDPATESTVVDEDGIGALAIALIAAGILVVGLGIAIGSFFVADRAVEAVITDKDCGIGPGSSSTITVQTKFPIPGIDHTITDFDNLQCSGLRDGEDGNFVEYHVQSGRTILYESEGGECIWDSETGFVC